MAHKIGDRVGAIFGEDGNKIKFLGYGVYEGNFYPEEAVGQVTEMAKSVHGKSYVNPRIRLDNGKAVYGCECWWGDEESIKELLESKKKTGSKIVDVDIDAIRAEYKSGK